MVLHNNKCTLLHMIVKRHVSCRIDLQPDVFKLYRCGIFGYLLLISILKIFQILV